MAKGALEDRPYCGKVSVTYGIVLLQRINAAARADGVSFAEAVRRICRQHFERLDATNNETGD